MAQPDPAAAALDPAGRCAGTAEPPAATTGPPEYGRLDRLFAAHRAGIAVQDAAATPYQRQALVDALAYAEARTPAEVVRLRAMVVALEASCFGRGTPGNDRCAQLASTPVHRTPARVRAELEER